MKHTHYSAYATNLLSCIHYAHSVYLYLSVTHTQGSTTYRHILHNPFRTMQISISINTFIATCVH